MDLRELERNWDEFGRSDPLWAILVEPGKKGNKWSRDEFFKTGENEVNEIMKEIGQMNVRVRRETALDFGCGVGRLSQALARYFEEVYGVDISASMIELAEKFNPRPRKCKFRLNRRADLGLFSDNSIDFILSSLTLQHMEPHYSRTYIRELMRILAPEGLFVIQLVEERVGLTSVLNRARQLSYRIRNRLQNHPIMEMHGLKKGEVVDLITDKGGKVLTVERLPDQGPGWASYRYIGTKGRG